MLCIAISAISSCTGITTNQTKSAYEETISQWKSYKDVEKWFQTNFTYDLDRLNMFKDYIEKKKRGSTFLPPPSVRTPKETFDLRSGVCCDGARFAKEVLNRINPSYKAKIVLLDFDDSQTPVNHYVCSFKIDGKIYIIDYATNDKATKGLHGPFDNLKEYKNYYEKRSKFRIISISYGWSRYTVLD